MTDIILVLDGDYSHGGYYRVDFVLEAIQRSGLTVRLFAAGSASRGKWAPEGFGVGDSPLLTLLNLLGSLLTFGGHTRFGQLVAMWSALERERPAIIIFYRHWTGLFLHFWRKIVGSRAKLVWEWYDLSTRMHLYQQRTTPMVDSVRLHLEERTSPRIFDALIVPTEFARHLLESWGHKSEKIHVLGEVRELNPFVDESVLRNRIKEVEKGVSLEVVWIGVIRHYQLDGLLGFLRALKLDQRPQRPMVIHIIGPAATEVDELTEIRGGVTPEVRVEWHGAVPLEDLDRIVAGAHLAVQPLPDELFCDFIYSRKLADYLAASLPVAFSALEGLREIGESFGASFELASPSSVTEALEFLSTPHRYHRHVLQAWEVAHSEFSERGLTKKGDALVAFLNGLGAAYKPA